MASKSKDEIKKDFADFANKIAKLESLKHRLSALNTGEFKGEVNVIKAKLNDVNNIPQAENEINALEEKIKQGQFRGIKTAIPKADGLAGSKYDDFVRNLKGQLSAQLKEKEEMAKLKTGLEKQRQEFSKKYIEMNKEFHKKYNEKVKQELEQDVRGKFDQMLGQRLSDEKKKIIGALVQEYARSIHNEKKKLIEKLNEDYLQKQKKLEEAYSKNKEKSEKSIEERKRLLENDYSHKAAEKSNILVSGLKKLELDKKRLLTEAEGIKNRAQNIDREVANKVNVTKKKLDTEYSHKTDLMITKLRNLDSEKRNLDREKERFQKLNQNLDDEIAKKVDETKKKMYVILASKFKEIQRKSNDVLSQKEKNLRPKLEKEYREKLKKEMRAKENQLEKKKKQLEKHIHQQARQLFG